MPAATSMRLLSCAGVPPPSPSPRLLSPRRLPIAALLLLALLAPAATPARAQVPVDVAPIPTGEPSAYRFYAAPGPSNFLMVEGTAIGREWEPSVSLLLDYAHRPFALDDVAYYTYSSDALTGDELDVVAGTMTAQITGAIGLADRVQLGLNLPVIAYTWGQGARWDEQVEGGRTAGNSFPSGSGTALGDPRVHGKVRLFDQDLGSGVTLGMAAVGWITFPVARAILPHRHAGEPSVSGGAHVVIDVRWQALRIALNAGFAAREDAQLVRSRRTSEMTWGAAVAYDFSEIAGALVELTGQTTFGLVYDDEAPTELRAAGSLRAGDLTFTLGAGAGLAYAIGVPVFRVLGGVSWEPRPRTDVDRDGVLDDVDGCPSEPEDLDESDDEDGCPDLDDDGDGIPDEADPCPRAAEDVDGHDDSDGCPDEDDDADGISDGFDSCPREPEDRDGDRDQDGCPDDDRDRDHVPDGTDACPEQAEDTDGLGDEDGCPEQDFDEDGVPDDQDECAEEAEDRDRRHDEDGCPE